MDGEQKVRIQFNGDSIRQKKKLNMVKRTLLLRKFISLLFRARQNEESSMYFDSSFT